MNNFASSFVAGLILTLAAIGPAPKAASAEKRVQKEPPGNPLFYGEWYRMHAFEPRAKGETWVDMVTVRMAPGKAITRRGARITLRREFELLKDFGDRMIVAMTTSQPGFNRRTTMVGALSIKWNNTWDGKPQMIEGRAVLQLYFHQCYGERSRAFSNYVLKPSKPSERWRRIQERSKNEIKSERFILPGSCAINGNGKPHGHYSVIDYYRVLSAEEQVRLEAGELGLKGDIPRRGGGE